jgi:hypothetical protein
MQHPRIAAIAACLALAQLAVAQVDKEVVIARNSKDGDEHRFTVEQKDPGDMNRLYAGAVILGMEVGDGFWMAFGVDAHYRLSDRITLNGSWFRAYAKGTDSEAGEYYNDRGKG